RGSARSLSARVLRRAAPAHLDRARGDPASRPARARRADVRARRLGAAAGAATAVVAAAPLPDGLRLHHARPRRHPRDGAPRDRDEGRTHRRGGRDGDAVRATAGRVYGGAAGRVGSEGRSLSLRGSPLALQVLLFTLFDVAGTAFAAPGGDFLAAAFGRDFDDSAAAGFGGRAVTGCFAAVSDDAFAAAGCRRRTACTIFGSSLRRTIRRSPFSVVSTVCVDAWRTFSTVPTFGLAPTLFHERNCATVVP